MWITTNWKVLKDTELPDHITCLLRNLYTLVISLLTKAPKPRREGLRLWSWKKLLPLCAVLRIINHLSFWLFLFLPPRLSQGNLQDLVLTRLHSETPKTDQQERQQPWHLYSASRQAWGDGFGVLFLGFFSFWPCWVFSASCQLSSCGMWAWLPHSRWDLSSLTRHWTRIPCIRRWILNHWNTREVPGLGCSWALGPWLWSERKEVAPAWPSR